MVVVAVVSVLVVVVHNSNSSCMCSGSIGPTLNSKLYHSNTIVHTTYRKKCITLIWQVDNVFIEARASISSFTVNEKCSLAHPQL